MRTSNFLAVAFASMMSQAGVMKLCIDVGYETSAVVAACVGFAEWEDEAAAFEHVRRFDTAPAPYEPGRFYRREMPFAIQLLRGLGEDVRASVIIVDGYVWLDGGRPGLGAILHEALGGGIAVVGVAKRPFHGGGNQAASLLRGTSAQPLFVSAVGLSLDEAVGGIARMHGPHRIPTLLKRVDRLSRC